MNQILIGAGIPFLISCIIYAAKGFRASIRFLVFAPAAMAAGAIWAIAPDIPRVLGMQQLYHELSQNPACDIFFWHYTIDNMEHDSNYYLAGFVLILASLLYTVWRELKAAETEGC